MTGEDLMTSMAAWSVVLLFILALLVVMVIAFWQIYVKAGEPGWASLVPFYSQYVLFKITWGNGWLFLIPTGLTFVSQVLERAGTGNFLAFPIYLASCAIGIMTVWKLAKAFGKGGGFAVGLFFLSPIFLCILGFGSARYLGPVRGGM